MSNPFAEALEQFLPAGLLHREDFIQKATRHLDLIVEANQRFNLTRITSPREAAVKHVLDSVWAWRMFADAKHVMDAGSGAGFPGVPLALALPEVRFTLAESVHKRARFLQSVVDELGLTNIDVVAERAETILSQTRTIDVITARAVAPIPRTILLFGPAWRAGTRALLFKGPDVDAEIAQAQAEARRYKLNVKVVDRYQLPCEMGQRTIVELSPKNGS